MKYATLLLGLLLIAGNTYALTITEIMPNPAGTDEGYEWIELYGNALDEETIFFEDGGNHLLSLYSGTCLTDCVIIIADDASHFTFNQSVLVYDTSFGSLKNSGEEVGVITSKNSLTITYLSAPSGKSWNGTEWGEPTLGTHQVAFVDKEIVDVPEFSGLGLFSLVGLLVFFILHKKNKKERSL